MATINVSKLSFAYENSHDLIFDDVSFSIDTGWKLGFCGRNGRGKTTFLRLLMGEFEYSGTISSGDLKFDYFPFKPHDADNLTQEILLEVAPSAELWQIKKELAKLALDESVLYQQFSTLSNGEQTKVLLAGLFLNDNHFLLIDEPTNHLDMQAREVVAKYLNSKKGFILVSHDRVFLDECVDHVLSINKNNIEVISGNFSTWLAQKEMQDAFELAENEKLEREIGRLEGSMKRSKGWASKAEGQKIGIDPNKVDNKMGHRAKQGAKAKKKESQVKAIQGRITRDIEAKQGLLRNIESSYTLKLQPQKHFSSRLITLKDVAISYEDKAILERFSLTVNHDDRVALVGGNGSGKSTIIKLICGLNIPHSGNVGIASRLIISYVSQDASHLSGNLRDYAIENKIDETLFKAILHKLDFSKTQFDKDISDFSAGQKKKVLIAHSLATKAHLYIWDEPLNYIDILSRIQIEELLLTYKPTMIFVEHDRAFCEKIATEKIKL